ncbi:MAG: VanZ family protein [Lachnospirales bacterium]
MNKKNLINIIFFIIIFAYLIFLFKLLFFKNFSPIEILDTSRAMSRRTNLNPFETITNYYIYSSKNFFVSGTNLFGNIIIFIPIGFLLKLFNTRFTSIFIFFITCFVELIQYILAIGVADIDDIILNYIGGLIGIALYIICNRCFKDNHKIKTIVVYSSIAILTLYFIFYLLFV